jgi:uncharacterized protein YqjF (DUF2071 family)
VPSPGDCSEQIGSRGYYRARHEDFGARHGDREPPPYYLEYGDKYFERFQELRERLSETGSSWVERTARKLQEAIEARCRLNPGAFDKLECRPREFTAFAYGSHPTAYLEAGLGALPLHDLMLVVKTPDAKDLLTERGIVQVLRTATELARRNDPHRNHRHHPSIGETIQDFESALKRLERDSSQFVAGEAKELRREVKGLLERGRRDLRRFFHDIGKITKPSWVMRQNWSSPLFCSWRLPPDRVRPLVPAELELDLRDGEAWVSLVPLEMEKVGLEKPKLPLPSLEPFPEVNLRTYVRHNGVAGVYFLSLECGQLMVDLGAKLLFHLPYHPADVSIGRDGEWFHCESEGKSPGGAPARFDCRYRPIGEPARPGPGSLEEFLTERYSMFVVDRGKVLRGDVKHEPWRVQGAEIQLKTNTITPAYGLPVTGKPDHVGFSPGVETKTVPFVEVR